MSRWARPTCLLRGTTRRRWIDEAREVADARGNYVVGANIAGFTKVAGAMVAHGPIRLRGAERRGAVRPS